MADQKQINGTRVGVSPGDLTDMEVDALIYYAAPDLELGSGFGTAIQMRGGQEVQKELDAVEGKPLPVGQAVVSGAGNLKAKHLIHAVGPRFHEDDSETKLRATVEAALQKAEEVGVESLAVPPLGAGFYGVPLDTCAQIMIDTLARHLNAGSKLKEVTIVTLDSREQGPFEAQLDALN